MWVLSTKYLCYNDNDNNNKNNNINNKYYLRTSDVAVQRDCQVHRGRRTRSDAPRDNDDGDNPARKDAATATTRKRSHTINTTAACVFI